ncbi:MAG: sigma-54 dependent transcriptional regulator [candidate division KSB1 bacterium]|nr:sigma-54 dependent transcriptional regulator [candidate division KSB1 bacterium]
MRRELPPALTRHDFEREFGLVGRSRPMLQLYETIEQVAPTDISVLIIGESGSGKELVARAIHGLSHRRYGPLIIVNCGAIPEGIIESELFGHERGAFTGAVGTRKGYFEAADGGTIFLDEIGEMPLSTQVKVLRVLEGKEFMRVGSTQVRRVDVRVIAATNRDLWERVEQGEFREDLYYRLNAVTIRVPPLRERPEDIPLLVRKFTHDFCRQNRIEFEGFTDGAMRLLQEYPWPGNVRELKNLVESVIVLERGRKVNELTIARYLKLPSPDRKTLPVRIGRPKEEVEREFLYRALLDLKAEIGQLRELILQRLTPLPSLNPWRGSPENDVQVTDVQASPASFDRDISLEEMEKELIARTLQRYGGNRRRAAKALKISERTLYRKIKEYQLPY